MADWAIYLDAVAFRDEAISIVLSNDGSKSPGVDGKSARHYESDDSRCSLRVLGFNIRKYYRSNVTLTIPSKKAVNRFKDKVRDIVNNLFPLNLELGIRKLNKAISGWGSYYRRVSSSRTFSSLDHFIWWKVFRRGKRLLNATFSRSYYNQYFISYRYDINRKNRSRTNRKHFGVWVNMDNKRAVIVNRLEFYRIRYIYPFPRLNPFFRMERLLLEQRKTINWLIKDLNHFH